MPDPDPLPPQPRAVFPVRWVLLLLPSVVARCTPMALDRMVVIQRGHGLYILFLILLVAVMLSFVLGFLLEKWLRGEIKSVVWALNYGFMILFGNGVVLFAVEAIRGARLK